MSQIFFFKCFFNCKNGSILTPLCSLISNRETYKFFRFPANDIECKVWAKSVRRADTYPTKNNKICSCYFKDSLRENEPTVFEWNKNSSFSFTSPEKHTKYAKENN